MMVGVVAGFIMMLMGALLAECALHCIARALWPSVGRIKVPLHTLEVR